MSKKRYYLENAPQAWSGIRQLHSADCALLPEKAEVKLVGTFSRAVTAMSMARKIHRKAVGCYSCCRA
ncbi:hypothetical protein PDESU_00236 [Pontiella desulfatans]|uniref:Uncharacterized protein n=1 Tax=Pontiella desulfatans TaxID=2750659 RepID=A0A6C2TWJ1_PONDE|nr:hypothetical protein [Pontiella desulfatans]VGO11691.1 hypothetical protein PDESU_00236 [Pontiella desulfatans]